MESILEKINKVKSEIGKISKDSTNPFFKSKYFDVNQLLEHVEPLLEKNGLVLLQPIKEGCVTTEIVDIKSGEKLESSICLPPSTDPQKIGSAITYYRRYTLQSLLALQSEDDDGNKAAGNNKKQAPKQKEKPILKKEGFEFLISDKATNADRNKALAGRRMSTAQKDAITQMIIELDMKENGN
jgi:hypothetical protein